MKDLILIVEDEFIVANDLRMMVTGAGCEVCGIAESYEEAMQMVELKKPSLVLLDIQIRGELNGIDIAEQLNRRNIGFIYISANSNQTMLEGVKTTQPFGFLVKPFREKDLMITLDIARYRQEERLNMAMQKEKFLANQLEQIVISEEDQQLKLYKTFCVLQSIIPFDLLTLHPQKNRIDLNKEICLINKGRDEYQLLRGADILQAVISTMQDFKRLNFAANTQAQTTIYNGNLFKRLRLDNPWIKHLSNHFNIESAIQIPINTGLGESYLLTFYGTDECLYKESQIETFNRMNTSIKPAIEQIIHHKPVASEVQAVTPEPWKSHKCEVNHPNNFEGIVGSIQQLIKVLDQVKIVASAETSVLILGESGTGKESIAHSIHALSNRNTKPMITVNCAALPATLIESELFGHEKGAFTGAMDKRKGKFEQADGGTIFLDEIGEMPLESQVKLLRVLQEKEIERLGSSQTIKVDVRILAATNRNLEKEVAEGRFRLDLYYRLNTFPVSLPALRQRKDDIQLLAQHFIDRFAIKNQKAPMQLSDNAIKQLTAYNWPGNIRELEHLMERNVLMSTSDILSSIELPSTENTVKPETPKVTQLVTMEEMEREYIMNVLHICNGKVAGLGGAAEILGMPTSTLNSKMLKLGIKKAANGYVVVPELCEL
jgi:transcriptional regulator with GAF, ATPase, and Fis domain